jgi:hypothetical protein
MAPADYATVSEGTLVGLARDRAGGHVDPQPLREHRLNHQTVKRSPAPGTINNLMKVAA